MTIKLEHLHDDILHIIIANYWAAEAATHTDPATNAEFEILSCEMVLDGFLFDGIMSDASIHAVLRESYGDFVEGIEGVAAPSIMNVLKFPLRFPAAKVEAAKKFIETLNFFKWN